MTPERKEALIADAARQTEKLMRERLDALGEGAMTVDEIEDLVEEVGCEVNSWLEERLIEEQTPPAANRAACPHCDEPARYKETRETPFLTTHGCRLVRRRYYHCVRCKRGFCPLDAVLGLEAGRTATRRVRAWQAKYGAQEGSFAAVPPILAELRGLTISESTVERTTVEVGACLAAAQRSQAEAAAKTVEAAVGAVAEPAPAPPERLYLAMDGTMCPLRERWRKDGSLGKLTTRYGEAKVGMAFTTGRKEGLDTGITRRGCVATLGDIVSFTPLMVWLARQWGAHRARELVVLGDGATWIWHWVRQFFPQAVQILDYWHVLERLYTVAEARFGSKTSEEAKQWVATMRCLLEDDLVEVVVGNIERWQPRLLKHRKLRDEQAAFLHGNRNRLRVPPGRRDVLGAGLHARQRSDRGALQTGRPEPPPRSGDALAGTHRGGSAGHPSVSPLHGSRGPASLLVGKMPRH